MPRKRFERAPPQRREALLDAATAEFAAHGYEGASLNRILRAAGFSKSSFYYYFDDKADLAAAMLERELATYLERWPGQARPDTAAAFWAEIERIAADGLQRMRQSPAGAEALSRLATAMARDPALMERLPRSMLAEAQDQLVALWRHGQEVGAVRRDLPLSSLLALLQGFKMAAVNVLLPAQRAPTAAEFETFLRVHLDVVRRVSEADDPFTKEHP